MDGCYGKLLDFIAKDKALYSEVVGELVADGNGYGFTQETYDSLMEKSKAGDFKSLTAEEKSLANELGAHMVAETFGNEGFMQKVIKGEPTLAEKMISRIKTLKNALSGNESTEARAERKRLEKAEKLWMKSVEDAGYKYVKGKLIKLLREKEEEKTASTEAVISEKDSQNAQEAETLDNAEASEYNGGAQFSRGSQKKKPINARLGVSVAKYIDHRLTKDERSYIWREVVALFNGFTGGVANGFVVEHGSVIYVVDAEKDDGPVDFGVRKRMTISNDELRARRIERINNEAISNGLISRELSDRIRTGRGHYYGSSLRRESGAELSDSKGEPQNNKAAIPGEVRGQDGGLTETAQFSLPNKNVKRNANREGSDGTQKYYLREEISSVVDAIVAEQMNFGERHGVLDFKTKRDVVRQVWEKLNSVSDDRERARIFSELADYFIDSAVAQKVLSKEDSAYLASAKRVMHKLDLDDIKPQIAEKLGARTSAYMVWGKRRGGESISLADAKKVFAESGIEIKATSDVEIFFEILDRYNEIKQWIKDESASIKESIPDAVIAQTKQEIVDSLLSYAEKNGSPVNFSRIVEQYERRIDRLNSRLEEQYKSARLTREIVFRAEQFKKLKLGKLHAASGFDPKMFRQVVGMLGGVVRGGKISEKKAREISAKLSDWLKDHEKRIKDSGADNEGRSFNLKTIIEFLDDIADSSRIGKDLTVSELKNLSYVMARLTTYVRDYGKIIRNGKMIDALPVAEGYVDKSKKSSKISRGPLRAFREWYLGKFADPATVMRYADGYDEHGFFTEMYNEFREGAIKVEVTRMELMQAYEEFLKDHKKYDDHLHEYVEFQGKRVPRNVLISLWMTTKRKQAQLGLAMEGAQFRAEPDTKEAKKNDDGTRVFDIAPFGDPARDIKKYPYTQAELDEMMKKIRTEVEKSLDDTDRAYIKMVEGIFKECGDIKYDVDMQRLGESNVDKSQYYFPIARADIAQTIEQESWQQGLDRVSHLSMNKDTVKGAHNRLYLSGVDAILARHVNQVSLYNGIATAVDNFNLLVNLKINDTGAAITVNNTVTRTDYGKAALDYLKKLKEDIERVNRMDLDDAGVTKFLAYLRSAYATSTLGANPKVWATQASSFIAANNVLDADSILKGFTLSAKGESSENAGPQHTEIVTEMSGAEEESYKNAQAVLKMEAVSKLSGNEFSYDGSTSLKDRVINFFDSLGNRAAHPDLGAVSLTKSSFRDDKAHGLTRQKVISFAAIPDVIARGRVVDVWKPANKPYQRITVAAPITIAGEKYYMGVMIQRDNQSQRMYLHDVITEKATSSFNTEPTTQESEGIRDEGHLFITSILRKALNVNNESQKKDASASKKLKDDDVDKYCPLAKHRNAMNTAYEAQSVSARRIGKVNDLLMKPIGAVDRFVIERLWGGCQVQIEKDGGAKVGTKENKEAAGKLLQKVILETQQNSLATERSSAMRSTNEVLKSLTMFSADAMKMIGRFFDAYGEASVIRQKLKDTTLTDAERKSLEARQKKVHKSLARSIAVLLSSAVFMAAIAAAFKALLGEYEDKEPEEITGDITADGIGNLFGGLPLVRDVYSFFESGYEINMSLLTPVNGLLDATNALMTIASDGASGKNVSSQDVASAIRKGFYAGGQILGLPAKNVYKYTAGIIKTVSPETGYAIDSVFTKPSIKADLKKAIESGDTKMIAKIAEVATGENYGMYTESTRKELQKLVEAGYTVFPRSVGETLTVDGETYELSSAQRKRFEKVYAISDKAVEELVELKQFKDATDEEQAKALKFIYDTYYSIAVDDLLGTDSTQKSVLFAELIDVEKLAMIVSHVSTLTADKDKEGKTVSGSRKQKVVAYVNALRLTAAEKFLVMGYLGYKNVHGEAQVKALLNRSGLSREEMAIVLSHCGYAA